jgi:soluble lytic murein transglycosylase-like protein
VIRHYTVRSGDSLYGIAARFHVKPAAIVRRNHIPSSLIVQLGQRLSIARRVHGAAAPTGRSGSSAISHDWAVLDQRSEPSRPDTQAIVRSTAQAWHVDPAFAQAISYQESGFNMREVSPAGAVGAMQVMPYTATYISTDVVHRSLDIYSARDNITAGVALLSVLYNETHSERVTAAAYYQGLGSVRATGMLRSTKQYVHDVMSLRRGF